jgi:hypothetical protein
MMGIAIVGYDFDENGNLKGFRRIVNGVENHYFYKKSSGSKTSDFYV